MGGAAATLTEVLNTLLRHVRMGGGREEEREREAMEEEYEVLLAAAKVLPGSVNFVVYCIRILCIIYIVHVQVCTCTVYVLYVYRYVHVQNMYCTCTGMYMYSICTVRVHVQYMYCTCTVYVLASMKIYMCIFHTCSFILLCVCIHVLASHGTS